MHSIQAKIGAIIPKHSQWIRHVCHNMAIKFTKIDFSNNNLRSTWNISQSKLALNAVLHEKIEFQINFQEKNLKFSS